MVKVHTSDGSGRNGKLTDSEKNKITHIYKDLTEVFEEDTYRMDFNEFADSHGLEFVGNGSGRAVFTTAYTNILKNGERSVIKIELTDVIVDVTAEVMNWHLVKAVDPEFASTRLASVQDYDKYARWEVMEMADELPNWQRVKSDKEYFDNSGWAIGDYGLDNTGIINGKLVMIDYGLEFEGVHGNPSLENTIYDDLPIRIEDFKDRNTTMGDEIENMQKRIQEKDITKKDILNGMGDRDGK